MFDAKWIRDNPDAFDAGLGRRGLPPEAARVLELDRLRRESQAAAQEIQAERNKLSKEIGAAKGRGEDTGGLMQRVAELKDKLAGAEDAARGRDADLEAALAQIPNLPAADVPDGADESANVELRRWGEPPSFDFKAKQHFELGEAYGEMDFERAARLSGARFVLLQGRLARLERALAAFMLDLHTTEFGYTETSPPVLVRDAALFGTGNLPKFADDLFRTEAIDTAAAAKMAADSVNQLRIKRGKELTEQDYEVLFKRFYEEDLRREAFRNAYWLIPTAEVPLTNLVRETILDEADLPIRVTAHTACFRAEAGAAGKDTRGMLRQHQFYKVELVSITHPDQSEAEHERMTTAAETVLQRLGIPYRVVVLSTGDMGFAARKTYDIEAWLPGQGTYREISSCSNCGDFQARRMGARFRPKGEKGTRFVHTLNGSGLAVGRTLIAVLENYQRSDGSVTVPEVLRPYMGGLEVIGADV